MPIWGVFVFVICLSSCRRMPIPVVKAEKGFLDLSKYDPNIKTSMRLEGEWEIYPDTFLLEKDFASGLELKPSFISLPNSWNVLKKDSTRPGDGYATFRLRIKVPEIKGDYSLRIPITSTAHQVWFDGRLIAKNGKVGRSKKEMRPENLPLIAPFYPSKDTAQIIVHVSNYYHISGGIAYEPLEFGPTGLLLKNKLHNVSYELFLFGSIIFMGFYHISLFLLRKRERAPLYLGLVCFLTATRIFLEGEHMLTQLFPAFGWVLQKKVQYITFFLAPPLFAKLATSLFPKDFRHQVVNGYLTYCVAISILTIVLDISFIRGILMIPHQISVLIFFAYITYVLSRTIQKKRQDSVFFGIGFFLVYLSIGTDMLYAHKILSFFIPVYIGLFLFLFAQSYLLSRRFAKAFQTVEERIQLLEAQRANRKVFISYSWMDRTVVDELDNALRALGINSIKDTRDLGYRESIKDFMSRVRESDYIIMVISKSYLESPNCMYEVLELLEEENFADRILPVVLPDAKIYTAEGRLHYIRYWESSIKELDRKLKKIHASNLDNVYAQMNKYVKIRASLDRFVSVIANMKAIDFETLKQSKYKVLLEAIDFDNEELISEFMHIYDLDNEDERNVELFKLYLKTSRTDISTHP